MSGPKDYKRPKGDLSFSQLIGNPRHLVPVGDYIFYQGYKGFVMDGNREQYLPKPNKMCFALSDPRVFGYGSGILVETDVGYEHRFVEKVRGRVIYLLKPLTGTPAPGNDVYKVLGISTQIIDERGKK